MVRLTDGIGPLKPAYGIWHDRRPDLYGRHSLVVVHQFAERFYCFGSRILKGWRLTGQNRGFQVRHRVRRSAFKKSTSASTLDISEFKLGGRMPGG